MLKWLREDVAPLVTTIAVPVVVAVTGLLAWNLNRSIAALDGEIKAREQTRLQIGDDRSFHFRIYEAVTTSLEGTDLRRQRVAQALVVAMLEPEDKLRAALLEVLGAEGAEEVREEATRALSDGATFTALQQDVALASRAPSGGWHTYAFDVFWCTANGDGARTAAERVLDALRRAGVKGRLRLRELAPSINASPGYRIDGLVIRREMGEEQPALEAKRVADAAIGEPDGGFLLTLSRQPTPGYMSLFICR